MQVSNVHLTNVKVGGPETAQSPAVSPRSPEGAGSSLEESSTHTPSAELVQLVKQVLNMPDMRPDRLDEVAKKLASGEYLTSAAAERTAAAILNAAE